ncbi:MAG: extracellular solute-binding protein [Treponema sp.]|jgi:putative aldouronate transport system substrate-binding protein|nr:extracellular solute-binding protein [Treponema sp.]
MMKTKILAFALGTVLALGMAFAGGGGQQTTAASEKPVEFTFAYYDNATLPFKSDWLTVQTVDKLFNVKVNWELVPTSDYTTKTSLWLNSGVNVPDAIGYLPVTGEYATLAQNGAVVCTSDVGNWTPHFNERVKEFGLQEEVDRLKLKDGKLYSLPSLFDKPFYTSGLLLREDLLAKYGMSAPKTYEDLYNFCKAYKKDNPSSYPFTLLMGTYLLHRMSQPAWDISLHLNGAGGSRVLSWDYSKNAYFTGATSSNYREYMRFWHRMYAEGLLDPEMKEPIDNDVWNRKMATGTSIATFAWYDQIGGITAASTIPGFKLNMYPPPAGPAGARAQPRNRTSNGILFPIATSQKANFEQIIRAVDRVFFSKEAATLWCLGVEGQTYTMEGNKIKYADSILSSADGIYKTMQLRYGCGSAGSQFVWKFDWEMTKYDANYESINHTVASMPGAIRPIPPVPKLDDRGAERASALMGPLFDTFAVWDDAFLTGKKSLDRDWDAYVAEMNAKGINDYLALYNANL